MKIRPLLALLALCATASTSHAALQSVSTYVQGLRIESGLAYVSLDNPLPVCGSRVWIDLSTPLGRTIYGTAMLGFSLSKPIQVRAYDESARSNGACQLFDINVNN